MHRCVRSLDLHLFDHVIEWMLWRLVCNGVVVVPNGAGVGFEPTSDLDRHCRVPT
jgi:hypothetical protein